MSVAKIGSFKRKPRHYMMAANSPGKRYHWIQICISGEVETPSSHIRLLNSSCKSIRRKWRRSIIPDVIRVECDADVKWWAARYKMAAAGYKWQDPILLVFGSLMDSKELSSIWDCFGDQKAIKTPKLNTI